MNRVHSWWCFLIYTKPNSWYQQTELLCVNRNSDFLFHIHANLTGVSPNFKAVLWRFRVIILIKCPFRDLEGKKKVICLFSIFFLFFFSSSYTDCLIGIIRRIINNFLPSFQPLCVPGNSFLYRLALVHEEDETIGCKCVRTGWSNESLDNVLDSLAVLWSALRNIRGDRHPAVQSAHLFRLNHSLNKIGFTVSDAWLNDSCWVDGAPSVLVFKPWPWANLVTVSGFPKRSSA